MTDAATASECLAHQSSRHRSPEACAPAHSSGTSLGDLTLCKEYTRLPSPRG
eukprot:CAMPEP_0204516212 /NCGR_PEP_ID=MMETSP0661-20131031/3025_1 /ASSEMBLY_ACC=CAM_ASM_000606 /TAXON_ID=109239 /ORGANISM="Alexandrium margalefi, Strain AMGDE01CS-322" /LENGTH=51 /DNA_ID=CAMNT_0051521559 /DNA_START=178 /DNA_END=330 /DNA_ORIENTATION=+